MKPKFNLLFSIVLILACGTVGIAQQPECDKDCVQSVRGMLTLSSHGFSTGFHEKANNRLGDKVGAAILQIYKGKALYKPDNIRTFLPVIQQAFIYPDMIEDPCDKDPKITAALLRRLKKRIRDRFLNQEITRTLNVIAIETHGAEAPCPTQASN